MNFLGYKRPDGKVGIRNHVLILPTCSCSSETCRKVAEQVKGTVAIPNQNGCAQVPGDLEITRQVLDGLEYAHGLSFSGRLTSPDSTSPERRPKSNFIQEA